MRAAACAGGKRRTGGSGHGLEGPGSGPSLENRALQPSRLTPVSHPERDARPGHRRPTLLFQHFPLSARPCADCARAARLRLAACGLLPARGGSLGRARTCQRVIRIRHPGRPALSDAARRPILRLYLDTRFCLSNRQTARSARQCCAGRYQFSRNLWITPIRFRLIPRRWGWACSGVAVAVGGECCLRAGFFVPGAGGLGHFGMWCGMGGGCPLFASSAACGLRGGWGAAARRGVAGVGWVGV